MAVVANLKCRRYLDEEPELLLDPVPVLVEPVPELVLVLVEPVPSVVDPLTFVLVLFTVLPGALSTVVPLCFIVPVP